MLGGLFWLFGMLDGFDHISRVYVRGGRQDFDVSRWRGKKEIEVEEASYCQVLRSDDSTPWLQWSGTMKIRYHPMAQSKMCDHTPQYPRGSLPN